MITLCFIFIIIPVTAVSQCIVSGNLTLAGLNYTIVYNCPLPYTKAIADCESRDMQVVLVKSRKEMSFLSGNIVNLGYNNLYFWMDNICPALGTIPDDPNLCLMMTANITSNATNYWNTGYIKLTDKCDTEIGWICEGKQDTDRCLLTTSTSTTTTSTSSTLTTTTPTSTTLTTTSTTSTTPTSTTTTTPISTTLTTTTPTSTSTSKSTSISTSSSETITSSTISVTMTANSPLTKDSNPTTTGTTEATTTPTLTSTTTGVPSICNDARERRLGSNLYFIFDQCYKNLANASSICVSRNSTLAVLASQQEITYLANLTVGESPHRNRSWSYWTGGLTEPGDCVLFMLDQSLAEDNVTAIKYRISMGYQCTESHPFICKTFLDTTEITLKLHRSNSQLGSVMDYRPSAIFLGSVGVGVLVMILVVVVIIDMPNLIGDFRRAKQRIGQFKSQNNKPKSYIREAPMTKQSTLTSEASTSSM